MIDQFLEPSSRSSTVERSAVEKSLLDEAHNAMDESMSAETERLLVRISPRGLFFILLKKIISLYPYYAVPDIFQIQLSSHLYQRLLYLSLYSPFDLPSLELYLLLLLSQLN